MHKKIALWSILVGAALSGFSQAASETDPTAPASAKSINKMLAAPAGGYFNIIKNNEFTPVKNQGMTGTCWCFSGTAVLESKVAKEQQLLPDVSEMYIVRNIYIEKAKNYILRQGHAQFSEGGLGHDVIRATALYGAMPESAYSGLSSKSNSHNHTKLFNALKNYADSIIAAKKEPDEKGTGRSTDWMKGYVKLLDFFLGVPPKNFKYNNQSYTAETFAKDFLHFNQDDYINITSFTHHPFYKPFILEVPDNFSNGSYYNLPLQEMIDLVKNALTNGQTILWDADVSNSGFNQGAGLALYSENPVVAAGKGKINADADENKWDADNRQGLYEALITQDDHLMQITGIEKSPGGKTFFIVKNSWGNMGPFNGFIHVSESYFAINTISLVVPKAGIPQALKDKLGIR